MSATPATPSTAPAIVVPKKADIRKRIAAVATPTGLDGEAAVFVKYANSTWKFMEVFQILEDMARAGMIFKNNSLPLELIIEQMTVPSGILDGEIGQYHARKVEVLCLMTSWRAMDLAAKAFEAITPFEKRQEVWAGILADESAEGVLRASQLIDKVDYKYSESDAVTSRELDAYRKQQWAKMFEIAHDDKHPAQKSAYAIILSKANPRRGDGHYDRECIQFIADTNTRQSYKDLKAIFADMGSEWPYSSSYNNLEDAVFRTESRAAHHAYRAIMMASKNVGLIGHAIRRFEKHMPEAGDLVTNHHIKRLYAQQEIEFNRVEREQIENKDSSFVADTKYAEIAAHYSKRDTLRAMAMVARCNRLRDEDIVQKLQDIGAIGEHRDACIDMLIGCATATSLKAATYMMLQDFLKNMPSTPDTQARKKLAIEKIAGLSEVVIKDNRRLPECLRAYAQVAKFADDETKDAVILALVNKNNSRNLNELFSLLTTRDIYAIQVGKDGDVNNGCVSFTACGKKAPFALQALMGLEKPNADTYRVIRKIANKFGGTMPQNACDYFMKNGSEAAIEEIKRLEGNLDVLTSLKALPTAQAIEELKKAFNKNAVGAVDALLDLRQAALATKQNDMRAFDDAIIEGVRKIAGKGETLVAAIRKDGTEQLKALFDRLAEVKIVDVLERFKAAVSVVEAEKAKKDAESLLACTPLKFPVRAHK